MANDLRDFLGKSAEFLPLDNAPKVFEEKAFLGLQKNLVEEKIRNLLCQQPALSFRLWAILSRDKLLMSFWKLLELIKSVQN